ncbi:alcohol dehydrogenase catalytic domain-containing protein [Bacillaceae bacterium SIJ1]|uniref:alcohol dehydrogenase catalytic domain-containing protein n=1 Tax=Litoribacterium kuwaitense TaxID=1398745 RepID=UPI0013EB4D1B|nr:alcohol dehydrogenase catalytic domain-containing protein [Litoribacterium kuwaitense]NGP45742.1 alcohol dehydrogenase catalytic domain-containing protein [Litoribacterium kuwaitense]
MTQATVMSQAFRLTQPGRFEEVTLNHDMPDEHVAVKNELASICHADLRYFTGDRRKEALEKKLPMALFHEGIARVVASNTDDIEVGKRVVIVPNIPGYVRGHYTKEECCAPCRRGGEDNYCANSVFLGSGYDGVGQSHLVLPKENVVLIPDDLPDDIAILAELCSVSLHAISHVSDYLKQGNVAVFGDGPVGYLTAAMLHYVYHVPKENLIVFGAAEEKLAQFSFATTHLVFDFDFLGHQGITTVFECTGGRFSESAINQAIDLIEPEGKLVLMGVTEDRVPINTRDVLEKGIQLFGSSRSSTKEFADLMQYFRDQAYQEALRKLLPDQFVDIRTPADLTKAMNKAAEHKGWHKVILNFKWED